MHHYLYLLEFPDGSRYVGAHSTKIEPKLDSTYLGSGKALPANRSGCRKTILGEYPDRESLMAAEEAFIVNNNCCEDESWFNIRIKTFDRHGTPGTSVNAGRSAQTHDYIRRATEKRKKYVGVARTPAQKADDVKKADRALGPNPKKALPGTKNPGFKSWYYITPQGRYVEVHDRTKEEMASELGFTKRQLTHRFHYTNQHLTGKTRPFLGWTFGNLPRPIEVEE